MHYRITLAYAFPTPCCGRIRWVDEEQSKKPRKQRLPKNFSKSSKYRCELIPGRPSLFIQQVVLRFVPSDKIVSVQIVPATMTTTSVVQTHDSASSFASSTPCRPSKLSLVAQEHIPNFLEEASLLQQSRWINDSTNGPIKKFE